MTTGPAFTVSDESRGTDETSWLDALVELGVPDLDLGTPRRVVVVAPHPDDEVLGVGGLVHRWAMAGTEVLVVAVTDGERSDPGAGPIGRRLLRSRRVRESSRALRGLAGTAEVRRLGLPDGGIERHEEVLQQEVEAAIVDGTVCATTWRGDGHPDHEATGRATARACASSGARLLEFPVWMWHWAAPGDRRVPWANARAEFVDGTTLRAKRIALEEFRSQQLVLPPHVLDRFRRPFEVVFT